jgi:hypothetical protein
VDSVAMEFAGVFNRDIDHANNVARASGLRSKKPQAGRMRYFGIGAC